MTDTGLDLNQILTAGQLTEPHTLGSETLLVNDPNMYALVDGLLATNILYDLSAMGGLTRGVPRGFNPTVLPDGVSDEQLRLF